MIKQLGLGWVSFAKAAPPAQYNKVSLKEDEREKRRILNYSYWGQIQKREKVERCGIISPSFSHSSLISSQEEKVGVQGRDRGSSNERK